MPEANVLYSVTAVVVVGLVAWVAVVLTKAKEPWARPGVSQPKPAREADVPIEGATESESASKVDAEAEVEVEAKAEEPAAEEPEPKTDEPEAEKTAEK